ncbi:MAG: hypothetical protein ACLPSW_29660 [Roseiarcus sp.]
MDESDPAIIERIRALDEDQQDFHYDFGVDKILAERCNCARPPKIHDLPKAKKHVRWGLEVAYYAVLRVRHEASGPMANDFDKLEKTAKAAHKALDALLNHLKPNAKSPAEIEVPILTSQAGLQDGAPRELHGRALAGARALWEAREIAGRLAGAALKKEVRVRKDRQNPGKPEHLIFAKTLAEIWVFLTGKKPSPNQSPEKNPFLRFVMAAWIDVFGHSDVADDPQFAGAISSLSFSANKIARLKERGPDWI